MNIYSYYKFYFSTIQTQNIRQKGKLKFELKDSDTRYVSAWNVQVPIVPTICTYVQNIINVHS